MYIATIPRDDGWIAGVVFCPKKKEKKGTQSLILVLSDTLSQTHKKQKRGSVYLYDTIQVGKEKKEVKTLWKMKRLAAPLHSLASLSKTKIK